mmetsp:Transcript_8719/g.23405  ORF Transcript_8719/g.23405 Transcript_8719/m.23405 type:complete len:252 (-) Transcript_8719:526-1281(-)
MLSEIASFDTGCAFTQAPRRHTCTHTETPLSCSAGRTVEDEKRTAAAAAAVVATTATSRRRYVHVSSSIARVTSADSRRSRDDFAASANHCCPARRLPASREGTSSSWVDASRRRAGRRETMWRTCLHVLIPFLRTTFDLGSHSGRRFPQISTSAGRPCRDEQYTCSRTSTITRTARALRSTPDDSSTASRGIRVWTDTAKRLVSSASSLAPCLATATSKGRTFSARRGACFTSATRPRRTARFRSADLAQ